MPVTDFLDRNAREYPNETALVELNPDEKDTRRTTWKEYELIQPDRFQPYRREITWSVFNEKANRFANLLLGRGIRKGDKVAIQLPGMAPHLFRRTEKRRHRRALQFPL